MVLFLALKLLNKVMSEYHPVVEQIKILLDAHGAQYQTFEHEEVRTSEEAAAVRPEYSLSQGAKALLVAYKVEGQRHFAQIVVPGDARFDSGKVRELFGVKKVRFASEEEVGELTDGILPGGVPPFGNLFGLPVFVDRSLFLHDEIIFNAGDKRYSIAMKSEDYKNVVEPEVVEVV